MALIHNVTFDSETRVLSLSDRAGNVISSCEVPARVVVKPLTFTSRGGGSIIRLAKTGTLSNEFEVDVGTGWTPYNLGTSITRNSGETVKFRCVNHPTTQSTSNYVHFEMSGVFEASGDCNSLLRPNYASLLSLNGYRYAFYKLFYGCGSLTTAPELPATKLVYECYYSMFSGCSSITQAPVLPATTLAQGCYSSMFYGCRSLTQAPPELPATALAEYCYSDMFHGCSSLTQAPALPATTLAYGCYSNMFYGCRSITQAPALPATTLAEGCYFSMFYGCRSITQAPKLPATTLSPNCYSSMFVECSSLVQAPVLPAITLAVYCYSQMFLGCSLLTEVYIAATTTATNALTNWLNSVAASGTVYADPSFTDLPTNSSSGVPSGWVRAQLPGTRSIEPEQAPVLRSIEPEQAPVLRSIEPEQAPVLRSAKKTKPRFDPYLIP